MNSLLAPHLEQISAAGASIASRQFAPPRIFTNAILRSKDIVSLIRDAHPHERALFTVPTPTHARPSETAVKPARGDKPQMAMAPRRNTAVHSVLGGDMIEQLKRGGAGGVAGGIGGVVTGEVDVELLLLGAEKLTAVYHIPDAAERIHRAREKFEQLTESITVHEALVEAQRSQLDLLNQPVDYDDEMPDAAVGEIKTEVITDEMLAEEEEAVRQLEKKKEELELKLKSIDRQMSTVYRNV